MQIREIHIDGFGIFSNKQVTGLTSGLNVIYGENEAGKTTLTEFIRRMLFGVSKRGKGFNAYPPLNGGRHGGKLKCQSAAGDMLLISRNLSSKDDIIFSTPSEDYRGQPALEAFLDHASTTIFQNIFAFTLDELQNFESLKGDEISNRIYGAELGLGSVSLKQVEASVHKRADAIFSPRGKKTHTYLLLQEIKTLEKNIRNIQNETEVYDQLMQHLDSCERQQTTLQAQMDSLESILRNLEALEGLYKAIDEEDAGLNELKIEKEPLSVNRDLLTHEADVIFLLQSMQSIQASLNDKVRIQRETTLLADKIQSDLKEIGVFWNEEKVNGFEFNRNQSDQIKSYFKTFENLRQEVIRAEDQLESHQNKKAEEQSRGSNIPLWLKFIAGCLSVLGLAGTTWSFLELNIPMLTASILSLLFGVFIFWKSVEGRSRFTREDLLEKKLEEKLDQAQLAYNRKTLEWRTWLKGINFDEKLEPLTAQEMANTLKEIQGKISHKAELNERLKEMITFEENIKRRIIDLKPLVPNQTFSDHTPSNIKIICECFDQAKINQQSKDQIGKQIQQQKFKLEKLKNQLQETQGSLEQILDKAGSPYGEKEPSIKRIFENQKFLQEEIRLASTQLKKLDEEKNQLHQTIGETRNKLRQLASNEELSIQQEMLEIKKQTLKECAEEWGKTRIALFMLNAAKSQYEKTRQPGVLKAAETIFSGITEAKYPRIIKPIGEEEILIENKTGERKKVTEMSRGTREQLYLSMRLGLIEEYETRSEPLPIIMDDVLVNFDDSRKIRVIETLKHFAQTRQVIVLTCHRSSLEDYIRSGAREIRI